MTGPGVVYLSPLLVVGDDEVTVSQLSVTSSVSTIPGPSVAVLPEPGTALLMGLGLLGLGVIGRPSPPGIQTRRERAQ
jgi:hypothetical protein